MPRLCAVHWAARHCCRSVSRPGAQSTCRAHYVLQHWQNPTFDARSRSARARTLRGSGARGARHAHARGHHTVGLRQCITLLLAAYTAGADLVAMPALTHTSPRVSTCPWPGASCALACAGASGEHRGPWSGRLLYVGLLVLYLTSTYFFFWGCCLVSRLFDPGKFPIMNF